MQKCAIFPTYRNINEPNTVKRCKFHAFIGNFGHMPAINSEIKFKTARSGGKGGQHVNKVETMVEGYWHIESSALFSEDEKSRIADKLSNRINAAGSLLVKSQTERTQLANKLQVIKKMNLLVKKALLVPKKRKPTKPGKAVKEKRKVSKKKTAEKKQERKKVTIHD